MNCSSLLSRLVLAIVCCLAAPSAQACSICVGDPNSPLTKGAVWGVTVLLGVVLSVLGGIAAFFIYTARRSSAIDQQKNLNSTVILTKKV